MPVCLEAENMAWAIPEYKREDVNRAARVLFYGASDPQEAEWAYTAVNNWRVSHSFPLNTFQNTLRYKAKQVDRKAVVAQRLKRLSSIGLKLARYPEMKLSQMQDIAGCRAIVGSVLSVDNLVRLYKHGDLKHERAHEDDYIKNPKDSGYRGVHLIYRYYSDKKTQTYNGLKVEVQFRSLLQHAWATAVETVGTFIQQALKSSQGQEDWLRFFSLMGTALAIREHTPPVPGTPIQRKELKEELREYARRLDVENHLRMYAAALQMPEQVRAKDAHYFLLELDAVAKHIKITGYKVDELEQASNDYLAVERETISGNRSRDAVLVSVDSFSALKRAYPNYFLDTHRFIRAVNKAIGPPSMKIAIREGKAVIVPVQQPELPLVWDSLTRSEPN